MDKRIATQPGQTTKSPPLLQKQTAGYQTPEGKTFKQGVTVIDFSNHTEPLTVVRTEKGMTYALIDPITGQVIEPQKVLQVALDLEITLQDGRLVLLEDFFVSALAPEGGAFIQAQAEYVFLTGNSSSPYWVLDPQSKLAEWTLEKPYTIWPNDSASGLPPWTHGAEQGVGVLVAAPVAAGLSTGGLGAALGLLGLAGGGGGGGGGSSGSSRPPIFTSHGLGTVEENTTAETEVYTAKAVPDGAGKSITYTLSGPDADQFNLSATTGALTFKTSPNAEAPTDAGADNTYNVTVTATDSAGLSSAQPVTITVQDIPDQAPTITSAAAVVVPENFNPAGSLLTIKAIPDVAGKSITYSLDGTDASLFTLDAATGQLRFKSSPDYETPLDVAGSGSVAANNIYDLIITATETDGLSSSQAVSIEVTNLSDVLTFSSASAVHVPENTSTTFYTAEALVEGGETTYSLAGGADSALFNLNPKTGALSFKSPPDFESPQDAGSDNLYNLTVVAQAAGQTKSQNVAITVDNVVLEVSAPLLNGVLNLDVQSNLVLSFDTAVQLATNSSLKIHIVHDEANQGVGDGFHVDSDWANQVAAHARDFEISLTDTRQISLSADGRSLVINPLGDLDFGSNYHIDVDAGAFIYNTPPSSSANAALVGLAAFSTVLPVATTAGQASQKMTDAGGLTSSQTYIDIEGRGNDAQVDTALNVSAGPYTLVYKDYDKAAGSLADAVTGIGNSVTGIGTGTTGFNLQVAGFGPDDLLYFDDQTVVNALSANRVAAFGGFQDGNVFNTPSIDSGGPVADFVGLLQIDPGGVGTYQAYIGFGVQDQFDLNAQLTQAVISA